LVAERQYGCLRGERSEGQRILWADVARNKATRLRWGETAEMVRNREGGWYWRGKPIHYNHLCWFRWKEPNPMGVVMVLCFAIAFGSSLWWTHIALTKYCHCTGFCSVFVTTSGY